MKVDPKLILEITECMAGMSSCNTVILATSLIAVYRSALEEYERTPDEALIVIGLHAERAIRFLCERYPARKTRDAVIAVLPVKALFLHDGDGNHSPPARR